MGGFAIGTLLAFWLARAYSGPVLAILKRMPETIPAPYRSMDYKQAYLEIVAIVSPRFPECHICIADLVRMLAYENDTLRMALNLPLAVNVVAATEYKK